MGMDEFRSKPVTYAQLAELKDCKTIKRVNEDIESFHQNPVLLKRQKLEEKTEWFVFDQSFKKGCLVIEEGGTLLELAKGALEDIGWNVVSANSIDDSTRLLNMRNWDAVFVDDDLSSSRCITNFREWELTHRVNRQKNVILISAHFEPSKGGGSSVFQVPTGVDGALPKLINNFELQNFLEQSSSSCNMVFRRIKLHSTKKKK
jgi:CheY-like chemotaxis protein